MFIQLEKWACQSWIKLFFYIEPNRNFPGVNDIRAAAEQSLDAGVLCGFDMTIRHLIDSCDTIYPLTIVSRNDLIHHMKKGGAYNG